MSEVWKPVPGWENLYEASDSGRIRSVARRVAFGSQTRLAGARIQKPWEHPAGYLMVHISRPGHRAKKAYVHRLVATAFLGEAVGLDVNHKNGVKTDNRLENIEWATRSENIRHARATGLMGRTKRTCRAPTTAAQKGNLWAMVDMGMTISDAARCLDLSVPTACRLNRMRLREMGAGDIL